MSLTEKLRKRKFNFLKNDVNFDELSPFAQFSCLTRDFTFTDKKGIVLDKWELWEKGYRDLKKLFAEKYPVNVNLHVYTPR